MKKIVVPFLRTPYNYDTEAASDESGLKCEDKSLAQQHLAEDADINNIVATFTRTGQLPVHNLPPLQQDFSDRVYSFQDALDLVVQAREAFQAMPAEVRNRFENDPGRFVDFCSDERNRDEMRKLGLWNEDANARFAAQAKETQDLVEAGKAAKAAQKAQQSQTATDKKTVT